MGNLQTKVKNISLQHLPFQVLVYHIVPYLSIKDLCHLSQICKEFNALIKNEVIWEIIWKRDYEKETFFSAEEEETIFLERAFRTLIFENSGLNNRSFSNFHDIEELKDKVFLFFDSLPKSHFSRKWFLISNIYVLQSKEMICVELANVDFVKELTLYLFSMVEPLIFGEYRVIFLKNWQEIIKLLSVNNQNKQIVTNTSWRENCKRRYEIEFSFKSSGIKNKFLRHLLHEESNKPSKIISSEANVPKKVIKKKKRCLSSGTLYRGPNAINLFLIESGLAGVDSLLSYLKKHYPYSDEIRAAKRFRVQGKSQTIYFDKVMINFFVSNVEFIKRDEMREFAFLYSMCEVFQCLTLLIDSSNSAKDSLIKLAEVLQNLMECWSFSCVLVMAHKQEQLDCMDIKTITEILKLSEIKGNWCILPTSIAIEETIASALSWIIAWSEKYDSSYIRRTHCEII